MNKLKIAIDDDEQRGWFACSFCIHEDPFVYAEVGYQPGGESRMNPEGIPVAHWIESHRQGRNGFKQCPAANDWRTNRYEVIDWRHGDQVLKQGLIRVALQISIE